MRSPKSTNVIYSKVVKRIRFNLLKVILSRHLLKMGFLFHLPCSSPRAKGLMRGTNRIRERTERWKVSIKSNGRGLASNVHYRPGFILLYIRLQNIENLYHFLYYYKTVIVKLVLFLK